MRGAGHYGERLIHMRRVAAKSGTAGGIKDEFVDGKTLWVAIEEPRGADKIMWGGLQTAVDCMVRVQGEVGVKSVDRFRDPITGEVLIINGIHPADYDQLCACTRLQEGVP